MSGETSSSKMYKRKMSIFWWTSRWAHIKFISRELTSVFVAGYVVMLLFYTRSIFQGQAAFEEFSSRMRSPIMLTLHVIALLALVFHSVTWFNLAPKAMVIKVGEKNIPGVVIVLLNYAGWFVISIFLIWLLSVNH